MGRSKTLVRASLLVLVAFFVAECSGSVGAATQSGRLAVNRAAAREAARETIGHLLLPAGAVRVRHEPSGDHELLAPSRQIDDPDMAHVILTSWWIVPRSAAQVLRYVGNHSSPGALQNESGAQQVSGASSHSLGSYWAFPGHGIARRHLQVTVMRLVDGRTGVMASADVDWVVPRPASEAVPSGVHSIVLRLVRPGHGNNQGSSTEMTLDASRVITPAISLVDSLPAEQPVELPCAEFLTTYRCPAHPAGPGSLSVRFLTRRGGATLAQARVGIPVDWAYTGVIGDPVRFWVHGRRAHALTGAKFVSKMLALVGLHTR
jgi:hypothetical protein